MMGWRGTVRSIGAAARRAEKRAQKRQRELERLEKQRSVLLEQELAAQEVADYEIYLSRMISVHLGVGEPIDWISISEAPEPKKPARLDVHEREAQDRLDSYKPGFLDKILRREEAKVAKLETDIVLARAQDTTDFEEADLSFNEALAQTTERKNLAIQVLRCSPEACLDVLNELSPFQEISDLGSKVGITINSENTAIISVEIDVHGEDVIPREKKYLLKSGKLSTKQLPKGEFYSYFQDYVCSCCLRIAGEIFAVLPMAVVVATAMDQVLNTKTGHVERQPILSVAIPRTTFETLNLSAIDPSDSMENFLHEMKWLKTKGFKPVAKITFETLPEPVKRLGPQLPSASYMSYMQSFSEESQRSFVTERTGPAWEVEAQTLLEDGKKLHAIKKVRETTSMSLRDAKELVESWEK